MLYRPTTALDGYRGLTCYAGDLHNHCGISYGHGSIEDAYANARLQLDFGTVTGHAAWPDMPAEPAHVARYHREGFQRLREQWEHVQDVTSAVHRDGEFVSFLSFEWHSMTYGDHCVYYDAGRGPLSPADAADLPTLRQALRELAGRGLRTMALPHHIGYLKGFRGINWSTYTDEFAPVVELLSMHGCGEDDRAPRPYLHTMGPRDSASTARAGLDLGHRFGFIGSTDHHSAHPGSHGYGRAMVWAEELTRAGIWDAIRARRTYCATGDRISAAVSIDGQPMGSELRRPGPRRIDVAVRGGSGIDDVEVIRNGEVIARESPATADPAAAPPTSFEGVLAVGLGWGEVGVQADWDIRFGVRGGRIRAVEPRLHGQDLLAPDVGERDRYHYSDWQQVDEGTVRLRTRTFGNPTVVTDATQRLALHVEGDAATRVVLTVGDREVTHTVGELLSGPRVGITDGFISPAYVFDRAEPYSALDVAFSLTDAGSGAAEDWYYVRARQYNDQYAWTSPIWVRR